ncbi:MAG: 50S ribosomal protein L4 [uncultured bacterium]|uniref:Large ribosomal subunit protein uL4 n=1 Tax=candidate division WWE3 bacterium RBG_16_37_10 TaxID=1802610 RepID=A0A1F4UYH0_UNCKA|nr:MAG: 50S ribosomal protein L4 [uncultured bacterium]OGC49997.1 MAG: 50S ribosomal protein L4 [candidate division WWE3 bacterium RBG_16_37_10]
MKSQVFDYKGVKVEDITLNDDIFGVKPKADLIANYVRVYLSNNRQGTSSTKTRAEVSGGGKKPWKQKGTGRARVGSTRNPLWRHGGISHGPKPKDWGLMMPKKMKKLATVMALSSKALSDNLKILSEINLKNSKTKEVKSILDSLKLSGRTLIVTDMKDDSLLRSVANLKNVDLSFVGTLNAFEILKSKNLIVLKSAVKSLENKYHAVK